MFLISILFKGVIKTQTMGNNIRCITYKWFLNNAISCHLYRDKNHRPYGLKIHCKDLSWKKASSLLEVNGKFPSIKEPWFFFLSLFIYLFFNESSMHMYPCVCMNVEARSWCSVSSSIISLFIYLFLSESSMHMYTCVYMIVEAMFNVFFNSFFIYLFFCELYIHMLICMLEARCQCLMSSSILPHLILWQSLLLNTDLTFIFFLFLLYWKQIPLSHKLS